MQITLTFLGVLQPVGNTVFDLRVPKQLGDVINKVPNAPGFDHNFCINCGSEQRLRFVARVSHPTSRRVMEVYSNQPGVQFFTSNFQPETDTLKGKDGFIKKHGALCLETQNFPDAVNHVSIIFDIFALIFKSNTNVMYILYSFFSIIVIFPLILMKLIIDVSNYNVSL